MTRKTYFDIFKTMALIEKDDWTKIQDSNPEVYITKGYRYLPIKTKSSRHFSLGFDSSNQHCLMFKVPKSLLGEKDFPDTEGLEVRIDFGFGESQIGVVLKLKSDDFLDVFTSLTNDLLSTLSELNDDRQFIDTFFGRLGIWKMFLDKSGAKGLGPDRRRGLFGELYLLKEMILKTHGSDGMKYWSGPSGAMHDFEVGSFAIECKTMAGNKSQKVTISNERQLEDEGYEDLYLTCIAITVRKNAIPSLVTIIKEIEQILEPDPLNLVNFRNNLLRCGYNAIHEDIYRREGYHIDDTLTYKVVEGFPRLLAEDLMDGLGGLKYTVDLSACVDFKVKNDVVMSRLEKSGTK
jgi:Putative  PD-(D/E)XK family member, (DUF4420)